MSLSLNVCWAPSLTQKAINQAEYNNIQINCLTSAIYFEAGNQNISGKMAIAFVIYNRSKKFNLDYCQVINQTLNGKRQFKYKTTRILYPENYNISKTVASNLYYNLSQYKDITQGALYFHAVYVHPNWRYKRTVQIQEHIFYK